MRNPFRKYKPFWTDERMKEETRAIEAWNCGEPDPRFWPRISYEEYVNIDPEVTERNTRVKERMLNTLEGRFQ